MIISSLPPNNANAVTPFNPVDNRPTGLENPDSRNSTLKPVVQSAEVARIESKIKRLKHAAEAKEEVSSALSESSKEKSAREANKGGSEQIRENEERARIKEEAEQRQMDIDRKRINELAARDREVRAHEQAHAAVGGQYAGAPKYQFERGPDGVSYAVAGEVSIDVGRAGTPQATIDKAQTVRRAALAPAEPSPQDRRVAAQATQLEAEARRDMRIEQVEQRKAELEERDRLEAENAEKEASDKADARDENKEASENGLGEPITPNRGFINSQSNDSARPGLIFDTIA